MAPRSCRPPRCRACESTAARRRPAARAAFLAAEVGLERLHPGDREQGRGVVGRRHERRRGHAQVAALLEERQIGLADLVRSSSRASQSRRAIVARPTTRSPASRHAVWPGADPVRRLGQLDLERLVLARLHGGQLAGDGARVVAQEHPVHPPAGAVQRRLADPNPSGRELLARAGDDRVRRRVGGEHVERLGEPPTPIPRRWPTVNAWWPRWRPSSRPRAVDDLAPGRSPRPPWRSRNERLPSPARKQRSWLSAFEATARPASRRDLAHPRLGQLGEREAKPRERAGSQPGEHVGLVLGRVGGAPPAAGPRRRRRRARSGRWRARRQPSRSASAIIASMPQLAVADHAGVRGARRRGSRR